MQTSSFDVHGIACIGCIGKVQRALRKLDGISHADFSLRPGIAAVQTGAVRVASIQIE